jgi:phage shock protein E
MRSFPARDALLVLSLLLASCDQSAAPGSTPVTAPSAALVIDVREPSEFAAGHLDAAENIPVGEVGARLDDIALKLGGDKTKPVVVYCMSGGRAARAKTALEQAGFTNVTNAGGYEQLKGAR